MNLNITSYVKPVKNLVTANSPVLLVGTAVVGVISTGVLSAKAGWNARGMADEAAVTKGEPLSNQELAQLTWKCYALPAVSGASSIASVVGVHTIHTKRHAAMAGLYAVASNKLDDYSEKAEELLGPKKTQQLNDSFGQAQADEHPFINNEVVMTGDGTQLCFDVWSGRWFNSSMTAIESAVNEVNMQLVESGDASMNEFYDKIGLDGVPIGEDFGWSGEKVSAQWGSVVTKDGQSAISFWFRQDPKPKLGRS